MSSTRTPSPGDLDVVLVVNDGDFRYPLFVEGGSAHGPSQENDICIGEGIGEHLISSRGSKIVWIPAVDLHVEVILLGDPRFVRCAVSDSRAVGSTTTSCKFVRCAV